MNSRSPVQGDDFPRHVLWQHGQFTGVMIEEGCVIDHSFGVPVERMVLEATNYGFPLSNEDQKLIRLRDYPESADVANEIADQAEFWLNERTPEGFLWTWRDGDFFLSRFCGDHCDDMYCACQGQG